MNSFKQNENQLQDFIFSSNWGQFSLLMHLVLPNDNYITISEFTLNSHNSYMYVTLHVFFYSSMILSLQ